MPSGRRPLADLRGSVRQGRTSGFGHKLSSLCTGKATGVVITSYPVPRRNCSPTKEEKLMIKVLAIASITLQVIAVSGSALAQQAGIKRTILRSIDFPEG